MSADLEQAEAPHQTFDVRNVGGWRRHFLDMILVLVKNCHG